MQALGGEGQAAPFGIHEIGVAAVDEDVAGFEIGFDLGDDAVDGFTGGDHQQHAARLFQLGHQRGIGVAAGDVFAGGIAIEKGLHF